MVVEVPEMGDEVQAIKAGLLEVADVIVVNKGDRPGADRAARQLRAMLSTAGGRVARKPPPVLVTTATSGDGVDKLVDGDRVASVRCALAGAGARPRPKPGAPGTVRRGLAECRGAIRLGRDCGIGGGSHARPDHRRRATPGETRKMSKVRVHISSSLDGYVAGRTRARKNPSARAANGFTTG